MCHHVQSIDWFTLFFHNHVFLSIFSLARLVTSNHSPEVKIIYFNYGNWFLAANWNFRRFGHIHNLIAIRCVAKKSAERAQSVKLKNANWEHFGRALDLLYPQVSPSSVNKCVKHLIMQMTLITIRTVTRKIRILFHSELNWINKHWAIYSFSFSRESNETFILIRCRTKAMTQFAHTNRTTSNRIPTPKKRKTKTHTHTHNYVGSDSRLPSNIWALFAPHHIA